MDLKAKQQIVVQQLQQAEQQAQLWSGRILELRGRVAVLSELIAEQEKDSAVPEEEPCQANPGSPKL